MNQTGLIEFENTDFQNSEPAMLVTASENLPQHLGLGSDTVAALAHDARNLITALGLYCDLLDEPGVLAPPFDHYRNELRLVTAAGRRLVSKLVARSEHDSAAPVSALDNAAPAPWLFTELCETVGPVPSSSARSIRQAPRSARFEDEFAATPITNLAAELLASRNLLAALAGPGIAVTVDVVEGARGIQLTAEDLTRILVNLVRNAADAMLSGGRIHISLSEIRPAGQSGPAGDAARLLLVFEDNGPGIPAEIIDKVFDRGFTTGAPTRPGQNWSNFHRGLGLAITRSIIESAGGRIEATNRPGGGARFALELPAF